MTTSFSESGVSLVDVLVTMAIVAVLAATAMPSHSATRDSMNRGLAIAEFDSAIRRARAEAVASGARAVVEISLGQDSYRVGLDYSPYQTPPAIEDARYTGNLPTAITISSSDPIYFDPRGYLINDTGATTQIDVTFYEQGTSYKTGTIFGAGYFE